MSISRKIAFNTIFSSIAKVSWTLVALVALGIVTRHLGADGFGNYTTILAFYFLLAALGDMGLGQIVLREISYKKGEKKEGRLVSTAFSLRLAASLVLVALTVALAGLLPYSEEVKKGIVLVSFGLFFSLGYQILTGIFQKRLLAYQVSAAEFVGRVANLAWVFLCYKFGWGLLPVVMGMLFSWATTFLIVFVMTSRKIRLRIGWEKEEAQRLLKSAFPLGLSVIITFIYFRVDTIILSIAKGSVEVGIYGAAYKIVENVSYFPAMFMGLIMPLFARYIFSDRKKFKQVAERAFEAMIFIGAGIGVGVYALAPKIIPIVVGEGFESSVTVLRILVLAILGIFFGQYFNMILIAAKQQKRLLVIFLAAAVLNVGFNLVFIPQYSFLAAAVISSATELLVPTLAVILVVKTCGYCPRWQPLAKILLSAGLMFGFLSYSAAWPIYLQIVLGGGIYSVASYLLGVFDKDDFKQLISMR